MTINVDPNHKSWQSHLNGLLALFCSHDPPSASPLNGLAMKNWNLLFLSGVNATQECDLIGAEAAIFAYRLQSRLYQLTPEMDTLFHDSTRPRKLDVQKIRVAVKSLYKDLNVACSELEREKRHRHLHEPLLGQKSAQSQEAVALRSPHCSRFDGEFWPAIQFRVTPGNC